LRKNVGGRPRKAKILGLRTDEGVGANRKDPKKKAARLEVHGTVQADVTEKVLELSKEYDNSAKGRTEFWKRAKPIMGDISRKRMKGMLAKNTKDQR